MRRKRLHVIGLLMLIPLFMLVTGTLALMPLMLVPILMLAPALFFREEPPSGPPDTEEGGGGGGGSRTPRPSSDAPTGGIPLPDAQPGGWRRRGGCDRPSHARRGRTRPAREPVRTPVRDPSRTTPERILT